MKYICLVTYGKGRVEGNEAEAAKVFLFKTLKEAESFKYFEEDLESKYWKKVDILEEGVGILLGYTNAPKSEVEYMRKRNPPMQS